mgnify:CR=1 FL=1
MRGSRRRTTVILAAFVAVGAVMVLPARSPMGPLLGKVASDVDLLTNMLKHTEPEAVAQAIAAGVGAQVTLRVGGKTDDRHGPPLTLTGYVRLIADGRFANRGPMYTGIEADMGRTVVFVVGEVEVILTEQRIQPYDCQALRCVGIEPRERLLIGLKSAVHFRADFGPLAQAIFEVDTPGVHNPDVTRLRFTRLRRPIWPLDETDRPDWGGAGAGGA